MKSTPRRKTALQKTCHSCKVTMPAKKYKDNEREVHSATVENPVQGSLLQRLDLRFQPEPRTVISSVCRIRVFLGISLLKYYYSGVLHILYCRNILRRSLIDGNMAPFKFHAELESLLFLPYMKKTRNSE
eukprot:scaffold3741_cov127-Cylindrotheca_fusiformis.AAC.4